MARDQTTLTELARLGFAELGAAERAAGRACAASVAGAALRGRRGSRSGAAPARASCASAARAELSRLLEDDGVRPGASSGCSGRPRGSAEFLVAASGASSPPWPSRWRAPPDAAPSTAPTLVGRRRTACSGRGRAGSRCGCATAAPAAARRVGPARARRPARRGRRRGGGPGGPRRRGARRVRSRCRAARGAGSRPRRSPRPASRSSGWARPARASSTTSATST